MSDISPDFILDVRRLRVLQELAERGSITDVAAAMHLTPSAVSQQLSVLARGAGVPLVERQGRGVRLTSQARVLLRHAEIVAEQLERARRDLEAHADGQTGTVTVGGFATALTGLVAPCLPALAQDRPGVAVEVVEAEDDATFGRLVAGDLDVLLFVRGPATPVTLDARLHQQTLHRDAMGLLVPEDHPLAAASTPVALGSLSSERWIGGVSTVCGQVAQNACLAAGFAPDVRHQAVEWAVHASLVAAGCGLALVPDLAFAAAPAGTVLRPLAAPVPTRVIAVAVRAGTEGSPLLQPVLAALQARAQELARPAKHGRKVRAAR